MVAQWSEQSAHNRLVVGSNPTRPTYFMNKGIQKLIADTAYKCVNHGISFRLEYTNQVNQENLPCSGYFDEKILAVAVNKPKTIDWVDVLAHESCHLDQFVEKHKLWVSDEKSLTIVEGWIRKKAYSKKELLTGFINTIALELDCEQRTVKKLLKYKIPFNKKAYIQKANSYLFSYAYTLQNKKWFPTPYEKPYIYNNMPTKFMTVNQYLDLTSKYLQYFN